MVAVTKADNMRVEDFDAWAARPENIDRRLEFIAEEIVEVVSNDIASSIAARLLILVGGFVMQHDLGVLTGADGGYAVGGERYIPDVAFIRHERRTVSGPVAYYPVAPDLAVEVISDPESKAEQTAIRRKMSSYLAAGTVVWVVDWMTRSVEVHAPGQSPRILEEAATLEGGAVLPGFSVALAAIFPAQPAADDAEQATDA